MTRRSIGIAVSMSGLFALCSAFRPVPLLQPTSSTHHRPPCRSRTSTTTTTAINPTPLFGVSRQNQPDEDDGNNKKSLWNRLTRRRQSAAAVNDDRPTGPLAPVRRLWNPKTFLLLAAVAGFRYEWCFRNPYYWFAVGFCVKWYRARYVFKIPVWDRQPNWNNIITSKEQEKDLKAFTCKQCGSTLFIAKTREFFFEGDTGIGGLGCFTCGAKGKENFVMDRDRIVEDVADVDDYFEYERPLDFVSRAERRAVMKEAAGDEDRANDLLMQRQTEEGGGGEDDDASGADRGDDDTVGSNGETTVMDAEIVEQTNDETSTTEEPEPSVEEAKDVDGEQKEKEEPVTASTEEVPVTQEKQEEQEEAANSTEESSAAKAEKETPEPVIEAKEEEKPAPAPKKKKDEPKAPSSVPASDDDIFDALDMD